jgi:hypothetical protein
MLVEILDTDRRGRLEARVFLCEMHARKLAAGEGLRWPEPHEHSARTTHRHGEKTDVRVLKDKDGECATCTAPTEEELNAFIRGEDKKVDQRFDELVAFTLGPRPEDGQ